ncbi:unnamed protein product [Rhizophagus irregularis]|nr:unnamed protein product [Rhizophagus irregularis]CAB4400953.1 unnamed protein product [Rhizophagus irregularis]
MRYLRKIRATSGADIIIIELTLSVIGCYSKIIIIKKVLSEDVCKNNVFPNNITRCKYALEIFTSPNYFTSNNVQGGKTLLLSCNILVKIIGKKCDHIGPTLHYANCESLH